MTGALLAAGTTSLWRLALRVGASRAEVPSVYRRFARFFQHVTFDSAAFARLIVSVRVLRLGARCTVKLLAADALQGSTVFELTKIEEIEASWPPTNQTSKTFVKGHKKAHRKGR